MVLNEKEYYESLCPVNKKAYNLFKEYSCSAGFGVCNSRRPHSGYLSGDD